LVLDEADEMLKLGFMEDLEVIFQAMPESRQSVLFSATLPHSIRAIAEKHLREPKRKSPARAVLRHPAALDPCHRREAPARAEAKVARACCSPPPCRTRSVPSPRSTCASRST